MTALELLKQNGWNPRRPTPTEEIEKLKIAFVVDLPRDYEEVMLNSNGCSLSSFQAPLIIWSTIEVLALFREHDLYEHIPETLIFGGDGGGTLYCYDLRTKNSEGAYDVILVKEDEAVYERIFFRTSSLSELVQDIVNNEPINRDIR